MIDVFLFVVSDLPVLKTVALSPQKWIRSGILTRRRSGGARDLGPHL